jgi:hypothetical protein
MSIGIGTTSTTNLTNDELTSFNSSLNLVVGEKKTVTAIVSSLKNDLTNKEDQLKQIESVLTLTKETIDGFNEMIVNIDKEIPSLLSEINEKVRNLGAAYTRRVQQNYVSDLSWELKQEIIRAGICGGITTDVKYQYWEVVKDPTTAQKATYYGVKYYRRPKNKDYNSSFSREIKSGFVGIGSTELTIFDPEGSFQIKVGDYVSDNLDKPYVWNIDNLPKIVDINPIQSLGIVTTIVGSISAGSTILKQSGTGIITSIVIEGDYVTNSATIDTNTSVVGFGTTDITLNIFDGSGTIGINTVTVSTLILNKPSIGSTGSDTFQFGRPVTYYSLILDKQPVNGGITTNFFVISSTSGNEEEINDSKSGDNPIQLGMLDTTEELGYGHSLQLVSNGSDLQSSSWNEFSGPEPLVGAGYSPYSTGKQEWPVTIISGITNYVPLGTKIEFHLCPEEVGVNTAISYVSPSPPSGATITALNQAVTTAQNELDSIITANVPKIEKLILMSKIPRELRDSKEGLAWGFERALAGLKSELAKLKRQIKTMEDTDYSEFYD